MYRLKEFFYCIRIKIVTYLTGIMQNAEMIPMKPGRKYMRISGGVLFLVLVGVGLMALNSSSIPLEQLPRTKVQRGEFVVSIDELGVFKAEKKTIITSPFRGKVLKIVPDGSEVKANQTVIWLDTEDIADQLESQMTNLKSVKMELESSIAQLLNSIKNNTIDAELAQAELEFNRLKLQEVSRRLETLETLKEQSLIPRREIDDAERKVKAAKLSTRSSDFSFQEKLETLKTEEKINRQKLQDIGIKGNLSEQKSASRNYILQKSRHRKAEYLCLQRDGDGG